ncbi:hypothetical protein CTheo_5966 [Ceratobasidium theobromae]|uniref:Uncharacterized protein n=1 Tax=Ceratobasidium theobromae TaxID=1582974 RepID=A0A5N5QH33_9AGAM|nr:hypothetical protein CTheo_5966 [Ceratobasidium theobromae]
MHADRKQPFDSSRVFQGVGGKRELGTPSQPQSRGASVTGLGFGTRGYLIDRSFRGINGRHTLCPSAFCYIGSPAKPMSGVNQPSRAETEEIQITENLDPASVINLARTCRILWKYMWKSRYVWQRALVNGQHEYPELPIGIVRHPRTLVILYFTRECVMCGSETTNAILEEFVRLCDTCAERELVPAPIQPPEFANLIIWQNGPHRYVRVVFRRDLPQTEAPALPVDVALGVVFRQGRLLAQPIPTTYDHFDGNDTAAYYQDTPLENPSAETINQLHGFPTDLSDDEGDPL